MRTNIYGAPAAIGGRYATGLFDAEHDKLRAALVNAQKQLAGYKSSAEKGWKMAQDRMEALKTLHAQLAAARSGGSTMQAVAAGAPTGYRSLAGISYIYDIMSKMVQNRQFAVALTPDTSLINNDNRFMFHGYNSLGEMTTAAQAVVQGNSVKRISANTGAAGIANVLSLPLSADAFSCGGVNAATGTPAATVYGWLIKLTGSINNFSYRPIQIDIGPPTVALGVVTLPTPVVSLAVQTARLPCEIFILSPSNASGVATLRPGRSASILGTNDSQGDFNIAAVRSIADANTFVSFESVNAMDLASRAIGAGAADADEFDWSGTRVLTGIRDHDPNFR